jgi:UDP-glucuronate 4-epimerase
MKVLVTGVAGFIGFHFAEKLVKEGYEVIGIDNLNSYYDVNLKIERLKILGIHHDNILESEKIIESDFYPSLKFLKLDLTNLNGLNEIFKSENFTHVVNLAAQAGVRYSIYKPHEYIQSNVVGFLNILECCRNNKIEHLIYASSSSVYGNSDEIPFNENQKVNQPISLYAATKISNELMAYTYSHLYQLQTTGLRFFTVYGPLGRPDMAPMLFAKAITNNEPIKVYNNGEMLRDFTYIDDITDGILQALNIKPNNRSTAEIFNIGNSTPIQLLDFIETLENELQIKSIKEFYPMQDGDVKMTYADTTKLTIAVGYKPKTPLDIGIKNFVKWYKEFYAK